MQGITRGIGSKLKAFIIELDSQLATAQPQAEIETLKQFLEVSDY